MKKVYINCAEISDRLQLHKTLARELEFPYWYGGNLDALHDCLGDISDDTLIVIENFAHLEKTLGNYALSFRKVMDNSAMENSCLIVDI